MSRRAHPICPTCDHCGQIIDIRKPLVRMESWRSGRGTEAVTHAQCAVSMVEAMVKNVEALR